jgi:hypothetical protein
MPLIYKTVTSFLFLLGVLFMNNQSFAQITIPEEILVSLKTGDSKKLSQYFNQNVDLVILGSDNVCSKAQAQQIVNKFFSNNTPESFTIIHQGGKEGDKYVIGNLKANTGSFRVYFLLKSNEGRNYIHQLRIEKQ